MFVYRRVRKDRKCMFSYKLYRFFGCWGIQEPMSFPAQMVPFCPKTMVSKSSLLLLWEWCRVIVRWEIPSKKPIPWNFTQNDLLWKGVTWFQPEKTSFSCFQYPFGQSISRPNCHFQKAGVCLQQKSISRDPGDLRTSEDMGVDPNHLPKSKGI